MSRFRIVHRGRAASGGGSSITYDNRFGTDTTTAASTGWFTFDLHSGCRRIWCDATNGNDANNGLTAATAKKTYAAALSLWAFSGFTAGDQLMFAGTGGRTYTDPGQNTLGNITFKHGISLAYPAAILSYDPAAPADSTKYGRLIGADQPVIQVAGPLAGTCSLAKSTDGSLGGSPDPSPGIDHYFAVQGITFDGQGLSGSGISYAGRHDGLCFQNCRFITTGLSMDNASSSYGRSQNLNISKCGFYGSWISGGNNPAFFGAVLDGLWLQDCVCVHASWKLGVTRAEDPSTGGATTLGQGTYYSAYNINGRFDRVVYANNAATGFNIRGGALCSQIVSFREPIACQLGGFSGSSSEAPDGVLTTVDDYVVMEGTDTSTEVSAPLPRGFGVNTSNTIAGSYIKNAVFADNSQYGDTNNKYFNSFRSDNIPPTQTLLFQTVRGWNYSPTVLVRDDPSQCIVNFSDVILDAAQSVSSGASTVWNGSTYPSPKTFAQVIATMGFASENAMYNAMVQYPHLPWAQAIHGIVLPAFGLTPQFATVSPPDISGLPAPASVSW